MQYLNFVHAKSGDVMHTAPVGPEERDYLEQVIETLRPLTNGEYLDGPAYILSTLASFSYVLSDRGLLWCIHWEPGLIVVLFSQDGEMSWTAIRSPVPGFGGRDATEEEWEAYDEDARDPQYRLIFDPWDAQFDEQKRSWLDFVPADCNKVQTFERLIAPANKLIGDLQQLDANQRNEWSERCKNNLQGWCGDGITLS